MIPFHEYFHGDDSTGASARATPDRLDGPASLAELIRQSPWASARCRKAR